MTVWSQDKKDKKEDKQASSKGFNEIKKESGAIPSIISDGTEFKGNVKTSAEIQIDGGLNGNVKANKVLIGINGNVRGNITAQLVRICGKIEGEIKAETLQIVKTASVKGNVHKKTISIEPGAKLIGNIHEFEGGTVPSKVIKLQRKNSNKKE
jgi:cytoskeletal protein CcmA (bactofilin family)